MKFDLEDKIDKNLKSNTKSNTDTNINIDTNIDTNIDNDINIDIKTEQTFGVIKKSVKSNKKSFLVYFEDELLKKLDNYCKKSGHNRNEMVKAMVNFCLDNAKIYNEK